MKQATASQLVTKSRLNTRLHATAEYFRSLWREEDGQDLVEYALLMSFIALGSLAVLSGAKGSITAFWQAINKDLSNAVSTAL